jgi:hypothetical protein
MPKLSDKLTEDQVRKIYNQAWYSGESCEKIGKRYGISESCVDEIKNGRIWSQITEHIKGNNKQKVFNEIERKTLKNAFSKAVISKYAGMMALDDYYIQLLDDDVENAIEFKTSFWQYRTERGLKGKIFTRKEVNRLSQNYSNYTFGLKHRNIYYLLKYLLQK